MRMSSGKINEAGCNRVRYSDLLPRKPVDQAERIRRKLSRALSPAIPPG